MLGVVSPPFSACVAPPVLSCRRPQRGVVYQVVLIRAALRVASHRTAISLRLIMRPEDTNIELSETCYAGGPLRGVPSVTSPCYR